MRVSNFIRPLRSEQATANMASYCRIPELGEGFKIKSIELNFDNANQFVSGLYGAIAMQRKGTVRIGFIYTSTPAEHSDFFKEPFLDQLSISAGYYTGGTLVAHSIPLYGCQQKGISLSTQDMGNGAFVVEGNVSYSFACADEDNNGTAVGGTGNNSDLRPWYHARA